MRSPLWTAIGYARVSGWGQAPGHGLQRQFESIADYAKANGGEIRAFFSDVGSGADETLPGRYAAKRLSGLMGCYILVESSDRWTRGRDVPIPANLRFSSPEFNDLYRTLVEIVDKDTK